MSGNTLVRLLDSFMRRWWLYLVPVLLLAGFGAVTASATKDSFVSIGTVSVSSSTLVEKLSQTNNTPNFGYDTPAGATTKQLGSQLQTDQFVTAIADRAGLTPQVASGVLTLQQIRAAITSYAAGSNLFHVAATYGDPAVAVRLAQATIDAFSQSVLDANLADSAGAMTFFDGQAKVYATDVDTARTALEQYLAANPGPKDTSSNRPADQTFKINQLTDDLTLAQSRYNGAVTKREEARLTSDQTKNEVGSRLVVVDKPETPLTRQPKLKGMVLTFAMFFVLGLILAVAGIVVATALDQGLRVLPDLRNRLGVPALAAIPDAGRIPRVTGIVAELPRRVTSTSERTVRRGRDSIVALQPERGVPRGLDVVDQPEPEPAQTHGPRRFGVSRPSSTTPVAGNSRRQGPIGHGRRGGID